MGERAKTIEYRFCAARRRRARVCRAESPRRRQTTRERCGGSGFKSSCPSQNIVASRIRQVLFSLLLVLVTRLKKQFTELFFLHLPRNQKRFHSRYNFGYGILLYIRKMPYFPPFTAHFCGLEGVFSFINDKSAILCPGKNGRYAIVQGV